MRQELVLTPEQIKAYRIKIADPVYMEHALGCITDRLVAELMPQDEPKMNDDGRVQCPTCDN